MRLPQVWPHGATAYLATHTLKVIDSIGSLPQQKVAVRTQAIQAKATQQSMLSTFLNDAQQLSFSLLARLGRQELPLWIELIECKAHQLTRLLRFRRYSHYLGF